MVTKRIVYVVDDAADYRFLILQVFTRFLPGCQARFFVSGEELVSCMQSEDVRPGLILMDLNMPPGMGGYETLRALRQNTGWKRVPVVMMSNAASDAEMEACFEAGANSFLAKPIDINQMKHLMESVCNYWLSLNRIPAEQ